MVQFNQVKLGTQPWAPVRFRGRPKVGGVYYLPTHVAAGSHANAKRKYFINSQRVVVDEVRGDVLFLSLM